MRQFVSELTHPLGGTLDVIIAGVTNKPRDMTVTDVGLIASNDDHVICVPISYGTKLYNED